jgi:multiple sugar transport system substrate-binding protein
LIERLLVDREWQETYRQIALRELGRELMPKPAAEWTWDDFLATVLFFSKAQNPDSPTQYGTALQAKAMWPNGKIWSSVLKSSGGSWFDEAGNPAFNTPAAKRAMDVYTTVMQKGGSSPQSITYEYMEPNEAIKTGDAAMILQWSVAHHELTDPEASPLVWDKIGIAPHPAGDVNHTVWLTALAVGLSKYSEHKEEAFEWLSFLCTEEAMRMYGMSGGNPPVASVLTELGGESPVLLYNLDFIDKYAMAFNAPQGKTVGVLRIIAQYVSSAVAGDLTSEEALAGIQREVTQLLSE